MAIPAPATSSSTTPAAFSSPTPGASLLLALRPPPPSAHSAEGADDFALPPARSTVLLIGSNHLAAVRLFALLEASYKVVVALPSAAQDSANALNGAISETESDVTANNGVNGLDGHASTGSTSTDVVDPGLRHLIRSESDRVFPISLPAPTSTSGAYAPADFRSFFLSLPQFDDILFVILTDTLLLSTTRSSQANSPQSLLALRHATHALRLPLNISDTPSLSDFSFPVTHRFPLATSTSAASAAPASATTTASPLQFALTTNASSCRLAARLKRDMVARCERSAGAAVLAVGRLRSELREQSRARSVERRLGDEEGDEDLEGMDLKGGLNRPVEQLAAGRVRRGCSRGRNAQGRSQSRGRVSERDTEVRMRWIAQISEYWPIDEIARLEWDDEERKRLLRIFDDEITASTPLPPVVAGAAAALPLPTAANAPSSSHHRLILSGPPPPRPLQRGRILLIGSGPGSPHLLTLAGYRALTSSATLILSDKLVPPPILALIPKHIPLHIAKKFPGNADNAQNEFMDIAVAAAARGEVVVRLKQGDPYLYGRGGEEVVFFRERGFEPIVVPGVSSSFAGPLLGGMPVTMRGVADSVIVCTGVGKAGKVMSGADWPKYHKKRTVCILMGVARLGEVVKGLTSAEAGYPSYLPIAIVEKASVSDGRVVRSSLEHIEKVYERQGGKRVPGMIMVGWGCMALEAAREAEKAGTETQLPPVAQENESDEALAERERAIVEKWLGPTAALVTEGGGTEGWDDVFGIVPAAAMAQLETSAASTPTTKVVEA